MPIDTSLDFVPINIAIITISDTRTIKDDTSGDILEGRINESGHKMIERTIIPDDVDKIKAFCIDMMKNHARTEIVLSNAMMRMLELEAKLAVLQTPPIKNKLFYNFRLFIEKLKLIRQIKQHQKNHSQRE